MSEPTQPNNQPGANPPGHGPWNPGQQPGQQGGQQQPGPQGQPGQPMGSYAYPGSPYGQMTPATDPARPKHVNVAFWLLIGSAVLGLISLPLALAYVNSPEYAEYLEKVFRQAGVEIDSAAVANGVAAGTVSALLSGILSLAVRVALAFLVRAGYNWARIVITIFAALSLFGLIGLFSTGVGAGILSLAAILATITAAVLLYMRPSKDYFTQKKAFRQAKKFGGYQS